jgi:hypothetical protein
LASGAARWTATGALVLAVAGAAWWNERSSREALLAEIEISRVSKRPVARPASAPGAALAATSRAESRILGERGEAEAARGDLAAALRTVRELRVLARDLASVQPEGLGPRVGMRDIIAEMRAVKILEAVAVHPSLDGAAAAELEAALAGPFAIEGWIRTVLDCEDWFDRMCLWALGPDGKAWASDPARASGIDPMWDEIIRAKRIGGRVPVPSWREMGRMRTVAAAVADAAGRKDFAALAPGGALDREFRALSVRPLGLGALGAPGPASFRHMLGWQSRVAVLRSAAEVAAARIRDGRLPAGIDRVDPFDGKPLEFLVGPGDGFAVRSRCWPDDEGRPVELRAPAR